MFRINKYPKTALLLLAFILLRLNSVTAQVVLPPTGIKFKLQLIEPNKWGVYAKPEGITPTTNNTIIGSGQVTVVFPAGYNVSPLTNVNGNWTATTPVNAPNENPTRRYQSYGFNNEVPMVQWQAGTETLLFTFNGNGNCPDSLYLIDNVTDPFNVLPNSEGNHPGNEITIFDMVTGDIYEYAGNYAPSAWSCEDNDSDGLLNAQEDTNGNGVFDPLVDASDLNAAPPTAPRQGITFKLKLIEPNKWGVFARPEGVTPTTNQTIIGSGQVTVVLPLGYAVSPLTNVNGNWTATTPINGPTENPTRRYQSYGFNNEVPMVPWQAGKETLLFTFNGTGICPDSLYLIDNETDPFNDLPNSEGNNPGNEITVFDMVTGDVYEYMGNYSPSAWSCNDCDGDGILNAFEDTDGDGAWNPFNEDLNANGTIDYDEDTNDDGFLNPGEDIDGDGVLDLVNEDVDGDGYLDPDVSPLCTSPCASFSVDPTNASVCAGNDTTFFATAAIPQGHFSFGWEYSDAPYTVWTPITFPDANFSHSITGAVASGTDVLTITNVAGMYGRRFRAVANATDCATTVYSDYATLNVQGPFSVADQPDPVAACHGSSASFSAKINFILPMDNITVQWQMSLDGGGTWNNLPNNPYYAGALTINNITGVTMLTVSNVSEPGNGAMFRVAYRSSTCNIQYSDAAILTVIGPMTVTNQPDNVTQCAGEGVSFSATVALMNGDSNSLIYQWEVAKYNQSTNSYLPYSDIAEGGVYSGTNTSILSISNVANMYRWRFRMRYRAPNCISATTNFSQLTVEGPVYVTNHPDHRTSCSGSATNFCIQTTNTGQGNITYQWQVNVSGDSLDASAWVNLPTNSVYNGVTTACLSVANVVGKDGFYYRCLIQTAECSTVASYAATLRVEGPISITSHPTDQTTCQGSPVIFTASASTHAGDLYYQWMVSSDDIIYSDLQEGGPNEIEGIDAPTLYIGNSEGLNGKWFRLAAKTGGCNFIPSQPAMLTTTDCGPKCLKAKLQLQPDSTSWAVVAKPSGSFDPTENAMTSTGRFTVVAPANFNLIGASNIAGEWSPPMLTENVAGHPGKKFYTFELITPPGSNGAHIPYSIHHDTPLFRFDHFGPCPQFLYLLEEPIPGLQPNQLGGTDLVDNLTPVDFEFCGAYARKAWRCQRPGGNWNGGGPIIVVTTDSLETDNPQAVVDRDGSIAEGSKTTETAWFTAAPNPAGDYVNITVSASLAEGQSRLLLFDLQGKKWLEASVNQTTTKLDLAGLPAGVYLVSLVQNGRVLQREKLVKH
ncbi:MAG: T9SS type A sorting domain-containing protein [Saprospiraceae bacterium]|nr:T9SS type A sorting domain-containing protein [Saprospiraceae bacterium]